jgi:hypothetical protein
MCGPDGNGIPKFLASSGVMELQGRDPPHIETKITAGIRYSILYTSPITTHTGIFFRRSLNAVDKIGTKNFKCDFCFLIQSGVIITTPEETCFTSVLKLMFLIPSFEFAQLLRSCGKYITLLLGKFTCKISVKIVAVEKRSFAGGIKVLLFESQAHNLLQIGQKSGRITETIKYSNLSLILLVVL